MPCASSGYWKVWGGAMGNNGINLNPEPRLKLAASIAKDSCMLRCGTATAKFETCGGEGAFCLFLRFGSLASGVVEEHLLIHFELSRICCGLPGRMNSTRTSPIPTCQRRGLCGQFGRSKRILIMFAPSCLPIPAGYGGCSA